MRSLCRLALALALVLSVASPGLAETATINASAPLVDHSEYAIKAALIVALRAAIQQAEAMGFAWVAIQRASVLEGRVTVQLLAQETDPTEEDEAEPGPPATLSL